MHSSPDRISVTTRNLLFFLVFVLFIPRENLHGADSLMTWSGEVRTRGEIDGRDFQNATPANLYALLRARMGVQIRPLENIDIFLQLQDSRYFGQTADLNEFNLYQGFLRIHNFPIRNLSFTLGRMELSYGNERIVGRGDWSNVGKSFDGVLLRFDPGKHVVDLFTTNVVELSVPPALVTRSSVAATGSEGFLFSGLHYTNLMFGHHIINVYAFHEWSHKDTSIAIEDRSRFTLGARVKGNLTGIFYDGEGAYQLGTLDTADIAAFMLLGNLGYAFQDFPIRSVAIGFDYFSGTPVGSSNVEAFNAPFATNHTALGIMDYFVNMPLQTFDRGLQDMYAQVVIGIVENLSFSLTGHNFELVEEYVGRKNLGQEIDLVGTWTYDEHVMFEFGGGGFFPDEILKFEFGGEDPGWWGYASVRAGF